MLLTPRILGNPGLCGPRVVVGDFNEWTRDLATHLLTMEFSGVEMTGYLGRSATFPGILPFLHLDQIYFDHALAVQSLAIHRSRASLIASDHLPLVVDFRTPIRSVN
jgi:endonuclease/exonuclease/phosphatase family metal-dependent hydrolase